VGIVGIVPDLRGGLRRLGRSRLTATAFALCAAFAVSGCAANFDAPTNEPYQPAAGISDRSGEVYAIDTLVVTDGSGNGTVVASLINQQQQNDALEGYSASAGNGDKITTAPLDQPIALPAYPSPDQNVQLATSGSLRLSGNVEAGTFVNLTFTFANAAPVSVQAPVLNGGPGSAYADVPVGPVSSASPTA
jgi:hypothetical protein